MSLDSSETYSQPLLPLFFQQERRYFGLCQGTVKSHDYLTLYHQVPFLPSDFMWNNMCIFLAILGVLFLNDIGMYIKSEMFFCVPMSWPYLSFYCVQYQYITGVDACGGGARGVMVIVIGNGHGDTSSNPGQDWLHFT